MSITIKKSSKTGRYYKWLMCELGSQCAWDVWHNLTLCKLVQNLFWRTLFLTLIGLFLLGGILETLFLALHPILTLFMEVDREFLFVGCVIWIFIIGGLVVYLLKRLSLKFKSTEDIEEKSKPSLVVEWIKAKKNKICPIIKVEE